MNKHESKKEEENERKGETCLGNRDCWITKYIRASSQKSGCLNRMMEGILDWR